MISIYGHSDDSFEAEVAPGSGPSVSVGEGEFAYAVVGDNKGGLRVFGEYAPGETACWRLSVEPIDEDVPIPWPVTVEMDGYSPIVVVRCPEGTPLTLGKGEPEMDKRRQERIRATALEAETRRTAAAEAKERAEYLRLHAKFGGGR